MLKFFKNCTKGGSGIDNTYILYHCHSDYSLLDSCTKFKDYVELAKANGQRAIASTEHGRPVGWVSKKMLCDKEGIRFIHGVEIYLTESLQEKVRDNCHTVLLARNLDGVKELNRLVSRSCDKDHFYYKEKKISWTTMDEVQNRTKQAVKKGKILLFHWRGGYLTREILGELLQIFDKEARAKEKRAYTSVNWAQAVLRVRFEDGVGEEQIEMEEANEGEKE